eukprot:1145836-Pelagomonas_calceolata.AAC.19
MTEVGVVHQGGQCTKQEAGNKVGYMNRLLGLEELGSLCRMVESTTKLLGEVQRPHSNAGALSRHQPGLCPTHRCGQLIDHFGGQQVPAPVHGTVAARALPLIQGLLCGDGACVNLALDG